MSQTTNELRALAKAWVAQAARLIDQNAEREPDGRPRLAEWVRVANSAKAGELNGCARELLSTLARHEQAQGGMAVAWVCRPGSPRDDSAAYIRTSRECHALPDGTPLYARPTADARQETQG